MLTQATPPLVERRRPVTHIARAGRPDRDGDVARASFQLALGIRRQCIAISGAERRPLHRRIQRGKVPPHRGSWRHSAP